jgi:hypothetical protein
MMLILAKKKRKEKGKGGQTHFLAALRAGIVND